MVYLRSLFNSKTVSLLLLCFIVGTSITEVKCTKIAYTKTLNGKTQIVKTKSLKHKAMEDVVTTTTTLKPFLEATTKEIPIASTTSSSIMLENLEFAESSHTSKTIKSREDKQEHTPPTAFKNESEKTEAPELTGTTDQNLEMQNSDPTTNHQIEEIVEPVLDIPENHIDIENNAANENNNADIASSSVIVEQIPVVNMTDVIVEMPSSSENATLHVIETSTQSSKRPIPCTCGIFMASQIKRSKNPYESPQGKPVITNELDRMFPCNAIGQKQCQTKCLEAIVQHLPNSANILCATVDRDIRKERAYLYIKNCKNLWYNTNLAAGREYCCKNGQPYQCPMV